MQSKKTAEILPRRSFIATGIAASAAVAVGQSLLSTHVLAAGFEVPKLAYPFNALEPHIDAKTMEIHHDKHHGAYVTNLNKALADNPDAAKLSIE